jgi:hypothetical protein
MRLERALAFQLAGVRRRVGVGQRGAGTIVFALPTAGHDPVRVMPVDYRIDAARQLITTTCVGYVTLSEVIAHFDQLDRDPERPPRLDVLLDLSQMTSLPESDQLRSVAKRIARPDGSTFGALAIVTQSDALYGMLRIFEVFAEPYFTAVHVFRDHDTAQTWLRIVHTKQADSA